MVWRRKRRAVSPEEVERLINALMSSVDDPVAQTRVSRMLLEVMTPESHPHYWGLTLMMLALALRDSDDTDAATLEAHSALLAAAAFFEGRDRGEWAEAQAMLGAAHRRMSSDGTRPQHIEEAIACYLRALGVPERTGRDRANDEYNIATLYRDRAEGDRQSNLDLAVVHGLAAAEGYNRDHEPKLWADAQHELGRSYLRRGRPLREDLDRAVTCFERALEVRDPTVNVDSWVSSIMGLSIALDRHPNDRADNRERALELQRQALEAIDIDHDPETWADLHYNIAITLGHREYGDRAEDGELALDHLRQALRVYTPETHPEGWADIHHSLGAAYDNRVVGDRKNNLDRAIEHFEQALAGARDTDARGMRARSLGIAHGHRYDHFRLNQEDLRKAEEYLEEALRLRPREDFPSEWAKTLESLAMLRVAYLPNDGRDEAWAVAMQQMDEAAAVHLEIGDDGTWRKNRAMCASALARSGQDTGRDDAVERAASMSTLLEHYTPEAAPRTCRMTAARYGQLLAKLDRWPEAAEVFLTGARATELLTAGALTRAGVEEGAREASAVMGWASYALARLARLDEAVVVLEQGRARALGELVGSDESVLDDLRSIDSGLVDAYAAARERLRAVQARDLSGSILDRFRPGDDTNGEVPADELATTARQVRTLRHEIDVLVGRIRRHEGFADFRRPPDLATVAEAADLDCPLAYINTTPWGTVTLLVSPGSDRRPDIEAIWSPDFTEKDITRIIMRPTNPVPSRVPIGMGFLMRQENLVATAFENGTAAVTRGAVFGSGVAQRTGRDEDGGMWQMGQQVVAPLAEALRRRRVTSVVLVPCGRLGQFPVHTAYHHDGADAPCLLDTADVAIAPSARVLIRARSRADGAWPEPTLAGAANPLPHATPLAFAAQELERITPLFSQAATVVGIDATRARVLSTARRASYVHLACHGTYTLGDHSPRLQFEGDSEIDLADILRDRPFSGARLVTLSACQSAIPSHRASVDEVDGLPSGIMSAGTPAVLATLWPVDDLSTTLLMERFYLLHLRGDPATGDGPLPPHRALSRAQRWLARITAAELRDYFRAEPDLAAAVERSPSGPRYPAAVAARYALHFELTEPDRRPFAESWFWAPFVLIGA